MYHILFIYSSVDGHLGCLHVLTIVSSAVKNIVCIYIYIHIYTHTHTYIYIHTYIYTLFFLNYTFVWIYAQVSQVAQLLKNLPAIQETQETQVLSLGWEDPLEKSMATHSSILAWRIPWMEELGGLQSIGSQRVRHN